MFIDTVAVSMTTIRSYDLYKVPPRWVFLRIETSSGLVGWGEPIIEGRADTVIAAVEELMDKYLIGEESAKIEHHWQLLYRGGFFRGGPILMSAIGGIDQALWDIKGKQHGAPVHDLLGSNVREQVRVYQNINSDDTDDYRDLANEAVEAGYNVLKLFPATQRQYVEGPEEIDEICRRVEIVRETVGPTVDIAVDLHGRISTSMCQRLCSRLDEFDPIFIEEPVRPERMLSIDRQSLSFQSPLALGERLHTRWEFKTHFNQIPIDIAQPDPTHAGGISEVRRIADIADANGIDLVFNCSVGPIASSSCLHLAAYAPNTVMQPTPANRYISDYIENPDVFSQQDSYVDVPSKPGLGIHIDRETVTEQAGNSVNWQNPIWRHDDMSFAEW